MIDERPDDEMLGQVFAEEFGTVFVRRAPNGTVLVDIDIDSEPAPVIVAVDDFVVYNTEAGLSEVESGTSSARSLCTRCGEWFPDDPKHPGYPDSHPCLHSAADKV